MKKTKGNKKRQSLQLILSIIPFIQLFLTYITNFIPISGNLLSNTFGYSLTNTLIYFILIDRLRFCIYTKIAVYSLALFNVMSLVSGCIGYDKYATLYDTIVIGSAMILIGAKFIKDDAITKLYFGRNSKSLRI